MALEPSLLLLLPDDLQEALLLHLNMRGLATLAASSKHLQALVARQPEATWSYVARQDPGACVCVCVCVCVCLCAFRVQGQPCRHPACAAYPPEDPVHRATCKLEALRLRHTVHATLQRGAYSRHNLVTPEGIASVNHCQHAALHLVGTMVWCCSP